jgi:hypothetical protein
MAEQDVLPGHPPQHRGLGRFITYFQNPENVLRAKLDGFLLLWMFVAGIMKEMDQSATTQAYVSGMKEDLSLYGNELNWFQTYFSIAYAIFIVPSQLLQTKLRPSLWLPFAEMGWGVVTLLYVFYFYMIDLWRRSVLMRTVRIKQSQRRRFTSYASSSARCPQRAGLV